MYKKMKGIPKPREEGVEKALNKVLFILGMISSFSIIQFSGITIFLLMSYGVLLYVILKGRVYINLKTPFIAVLMAFTMTFFLSAISGLPNGYSANNWKGIINFYSIFLLASSLQMLSAEGAGQANGLRWLLKGLNWSCRIQSIWILIQIILWSSIRLDLNDVVFHQILGLVEVASQYKGSGYIPTGLCWNAGGVAPILFLGYFLEENPYLKLMTVISSFVTQSATLAIGITICVLVDLLIRKTKRTGKTGHQSRKRNIIKTLFMIGVIAIRVSVSHDFLAVQVARLGEIFQYRLSGVFGSGASIDSSTEAHLGYLLNIPKILSVESVWNLLFGYGMNCSGFAYSAVTGQYSDQTWIVECDLTNNLLNYGLSGFLVFYYWLIHGITHIDVELEHVKLGLLIVLVMGITYNLQFIWMIFVEMYIFLQTPSMPDGIIRQPQTLGLPASKASYVNDFQRIG